MNVNTTTPVLRSPGAAAGPPDMDQPSWANEFLTPAWTSEAEGIVAHAEYLIETGRIYQ